jgi:predicted Zn-dependent protease
MDKHAREALARRVLAFAGTAQAEAIVSDVDAGLTRFTHNAIHQNVASADTSVRVRAIVAGRTGVAATNDLGDAALRATVDRALAMAALAPRDDDDAPGLAHNTGPASPAGAYDEGTAAASPATRARVVAEICSVAERHALWAAGYVATERAGTTIANSAGTLVSYDGTSCALNVKANGPDSTGFAERFSTTVADLDGTKAGSVAADKALRAREPIDVPPGEWTVILEPAAFGELLSYLSDHFSAQAYDEGSSFLCDGLERAYAGPTVSIADDYAHPLLAGQPFDFEGYPTARVPLFERGVASRLLTDATWAKRLALPNTGHGLPAPNPHGPSARSVVVAPGTATLPELIAGTQRGLLVTRFWYIRPVDQRKTIVTGMTRDGTFLIENGEIARGVRNMRFNQSILGALGQAVFSCDPARTGGYAYSMVVPAVKIDGFRFSSGTAF